MVKVEIVVLAKIKNFYLPYLWPRSCVTWLFLMLTPKKAPEQKSEKCIPREMSSLYFLLQDFPPTMMPF
jgi:hypothetical protein